MARPKRTTAIRSEPVAAHAALPALGDALFRALFDQLPNPAYIWRRTPDDDFELVGSNCAAANVPFSNVSKLLGRRASDLQSSQAHDLLRDLRQCLETREAIRREVQHRYLGTGAMRTLAITVMPVCGTIAVLHTEDITDRRRAELALRESEARVRALLDANPDMIVRLNRDGCYLDVHARDRSRPYLPVPAEKFVGRNVREIFDEEFARQHQKYREAALDTGQLQLWEYVRPFQGEMRHIEARFVKSGDDEVVVTLRDITERVRLEQDVIGSVERERERVGHDLHDGLAQLLTGVKLLLEPLKDKLAQEGSRHGATVERAVELVGQAIADTRELARGLSPIPKSATFTDALRELAEQSERLLGVHCQLVEDSAPAQLGDTAAMHIYRIAQEAITNAARHGKAKHVQLGCTTDSGRLKLTVADDGIGLSRAQPTEGGLGLRIMHYRARSIGGDLSFAERAAGGTVVTLACPLGAVAP